MAFITKRKCLAWTIVGFIAWVSLTSAQKSEYPMGIGGEKATYNVTPFVDETYENFTNFRRHNLCGRYEQFRTGELELRDALRGLEISVFTTHYRNKNIFFHYLEDTGIDPEYPGIMPRLMDLMAERAGFTWRHSFAIHGLPEEYNMTWTEMLWWGINTFDVGMEFWDHSLFRLEMGATFVDPWYDASIILVDKLSSHEINTWDTSMLWNWARPFEPAVWILIGVTIFISGLVYQLIEHLHGEQQERSPRQSFWDNLYLAALNFTNEFEYAPASGPGRMFAVSMAMWALVISATYTANLASLFVADQPRHTISSIEEAVANKLRICTEHNTNADDLIKERYKSAIRVPRPTQADMYPALQNGECDIMATSVSGWNSFKIQEKYNPDCNLHRVGETVARVKSGFAIKADVGYKCSSLIRDVLNVYMQEIIRDGELIDAWREHMARLEDNDCSETVPEGTRKLGSTNPKQQDSTGRRLRAAIAPEPSSGEGESSLTLQQMIGTFILHYLLMALAVVASLLSPYWLRLTEKWGWPQPEPLIIRSHGPAVGPPPSMDAMSCRSAIQAYGSPIGKPGRVSINTYVLPEKAPLDGIKESNRGDFLWDDSVKGNYNYSVRVAEPDEVGCSQRHEADISAASLSRIQEHFDAKLAAELQKASAQYEEKLSQQMGIVISMLNDMKNQERQRQEGTHSTLGPPNQLTDERPQKKDFGRYVRSLHEETHSTLRPMEGKPLRNRDFGQYLRRQSQEKGR